MNKHISEEKLIQQFRDIADYEVPPESIRRDLADIRKQLIDQKYIKFPAGKKVWRMIMQSKMTKYVSAAMVFFAVFISIPFLPGTELNAAELLIKVSKNMRQFKIVRSVTENYQPGQPEPAAGKIAIIDYNRKQCFITFSKGYLHQMDYDKMIWSIYRPEDNSMIVKPLNGKWLGPDAQVDEYIKKLSQEGLEVHQNELLNDGIKLTVIEYDEILNNISVDPNSYMSKMMMGNTTVKRIHTKLIVNRDQLYLGKAEINYYDPQGNLIITKKSTSEPADDAPKDIYELGVPDDVQIINKVPDERVKEVRKLIKENQSRFLKNYVAIQLENRVEPDGTESLIEGMVIYSKGKELRVDVFGRKYQPDDDKAILDQVEALMIDSKTRIQPYVSQEFRPRAIRFYDGLWQHNLDDYYGDQFVIHSPQRRPDGDVYGDDDLDDFGWRVLWMHTEPEWMYEDDFSKENSLLGMEVTWQSQWGRLPERKVLYVDPAKDYLFRRYTEEKLVDAPWQIENWLESARNKDQIEEEVCIYDVTEYGQTSSGQWYPKTITIKGYRCRPLNEYIPNQQKRPLNRISRIYLLEENPDLPDELFDPEQLSALDVEKK